MWATLILGTSIGFLGSFHCIAMCGPIAAYIHNSTSLKSSVILYNLGRVLTYMILGVLLALVGGGFEFFGLQRWLSVAAGAFVLIVVLFPVVQKKYAYLASAVAPLNKLKHQLSKSTKKGKVMPYLFIGMLNGLLPCGVVYLALATSISTANITSAAMLMLGFGIGTWPLMLMVGYSMKFFGKAGRLRLNYVVPALSVLIGVLLIMRGLALDIPYVSPMLSKIGPDYGFANCAQP